MDIKVGVIGVGTMGQHHVRLFSMIHGVELVGISDTNQSALKQISGKYHVKGCPDYHTLLSEKPDAVSIAVPTSMHFRTALDAISQGCHVLLEKPIAGNTKEAYGIIRAAEKKGVKLMIGHTERFNPAVTAVKAILESEKIISIDMTRVGPLPPRVKDVGIIIDLAIHDIDIIRYLTGSEIRSAYSLHKSVSGPKEDTAMILLKLKNGVMAHITTNWLTPFKARNFQIATESMFIKADLLTQSISIYSRVPKNEDGGLINKRILSYQEPLKLELEAFIKSIRGKCHIPISGEDGLKALMVAERCLKSSFGKAD